MATLLPSLRGLACSVYAGEIQLSGLSGAAHQNYGNNNTQISTKTDMFRRNTQEVLSSAWQRCSLKAFAATEILPYLDVKGKKDQKEKSSTYLFRTEIGGQVKVSVWRKSMKDVVSIEVPSMSNWTADNNLVLSWGIFRSSSSSWLILDSQSSSQSPPDAIYTPFGKKSNDGYEVELEFDSNQAPFYLSFLLFSSSGRSSDSGIRTHRKTNFCVPVGIGSGYPAPLGVSFCNDGSVNFSLFSRNAEKVILCLFDDEMRSGSTLEIELDPYINRTGDIWHVLMENVDNYVSYGYRCKGDFLWDKGGRFHMRHVLLDPYAKVLGAFVPDEGESISLIKCLGQLCKETAFDWTGEIRPCLSMEKLMIYRLNVSRFTEDKSSALPGGVAGTFLGVIKKLSHFKSLGVNAVLLEPIFPFDEQKGPYLPYHFFSPSNSYRSIHDQSAISAMKEMVKSLHVNGIEVLLEVCFNQTAEGGDASCQTITFRGIDNSSYYIVDGNEGLGANNALNCNHPVVQQLILDSLRYWVTEFHIDGFCFMDALSLTRGFKGEHLSRPPLVEAIAFDPVLSKSKIIADCWSPAENSYKGTQFPHWKRWAEMNSRFCQDVRNFLRGEGHLSDLATRLCGSGDIFTDERGPAFSFNFFSRNFGLSIVDLVSFSDDKLSSELSWNCGEEGPTNNTIVLETRVKQIRNFLFVLYISLGVPVLNMGDECGLSTGGCPFYTARKSLNWSSLRTGFGVQMTQFIAFLSKLRTTRSDLLQVRNFLKEENIDWQGNDQSIPRWEDPDSKLLAMTLKTEKDDKGDLFIVFNSGKSIENITLPGMSEGKEWTRLIDTALPFPGFFTMDGEPIVQQETEISTVQQETKISTVQQETEISTYEIKPHSCALFEARQAANGISGSN